MDLILHRPDASERELRRAYQDAFGAAHELIIVSAYLTDWDDSLPLNRKCRSFKLIIGKDFGITRKEACRKALTWLPKEWKHQFQVADDIDGFHPKAIFWRDGEGRCWSVIGSSNLTRAAFDGNFEANVKVEISETAFKQAKLWVAEIEDYCIPVSDDWLDLYREAKRPSTKDDGGDDNRVAVFKLPRPRGLEKLLEDRRAQLRAFAVHRAGLVKLVKTCANGEIASEQFYDDLPNFWSFEQGDRLQGQGWERQGKGSDFRSLCRAIVAIMEADKPEQDGVVRREIDRLADESVTTRGALLSELLCLLYPKRFPILNEPVWNFIAAINLRAARGASEGARYIDLACKLRMALRQNPDHPARSLAELDAVIWKAHRSR